MTWPTSPPSYARGSIIDPSTGTAIDLGNIKRERQELEFGLWQKPIPLAGTYAALLSSPFGKAREIVIEGSMIGTMDSIEEDLIQPIERWMNSGDVDSPTLPDKKWYFPFFHGQGNAYKPGAGDSLNGYVSTYSGAASPTQRYKYDVLVDAFSWEYNDEHPNKIEYLLVLREGTIFDGFDNTTS